MTHAVQVEIICDLCQSRFAGSVENIPNTTGRTKGTPLVSVRKQAEVAGWSRLQLTGNLGLPVDGIRRTTMRLDLCPKCSESRDSAVKHLRSLPLWFEDRGMGEFGRVKP
jgi:hypothetical protein